MSYWSEFKECCKHDNKFNSISIIEGIIFFVIVGFWVESYKLMKNRGGKDAPEVPKRES